MPIIDHVSLVVSNYERSKEFYVKTLAPLGIHVLMDFGTTCGLAST